MILGSRLYADDDRQGNRIYLRVFHNEKKENVSANIHLKLKSEKHPRLIGSYHFDEKTFYCIRKMSKHYHYATKGFGFNWRILEDPYLDIQRIEMVLDDEVHYNFPKSLIKEYGTFLNFKEQGFELQRFIRLELIKNYRKNKTDDTAE